METLLSDIRYGFRLIIKNPVFSLVVVIGQPRALPPAPDVPVSVLMAAKFSPAP